MIRSNCIGRQFLRYNASSDPSLETSLAVPTGLMGSDILGRAMVIHDFTGARIACGLIHKAQKEKKTLSCY